MQPVDLKVVAEEVKAIFKKHDIGGFFVLHENHPEGDVAAGNSEFVYMLEPSYSAIKFEPRPDGSSFVRIKATAAECGSPERRNYMIAATENLLLHVNKNMADAVRNTRSLQAMLTDKTGGHDAVD